MAQDKQDTKFAGLRAAVERSKGRTLKDLFAADPERFDRYHVALGDVVFDYSKHRVDEDVLHALFDLARAQKLEEKRDRMFTGGVVNPTESRAALHTALRAPQGASVTVDGQDVMPEVLSVRAKVAAFARRACATAASRARRGASSPTSSTSASAAPTSAPPWRPGRWRPSAIRASARISCPTSTAPTSATR